jgi:hypothetical protein
MKDTFILVSQKIGLNIKLRKAQNSVTVKNIIHSLLDSSVEDEIKCNIPVLR